MIFIISWLITGRFERDLQMLLWATLYVRKVLSRWWNGTAHLLNLYMLPGCWCSCISDLYSGDSWFVF
jgi:hypothetical protein